MRLAPLFILALLLRGAELSSVHYVYLLPMSGGLEQYVANRLTEKAVFQVVTDPKRADAVITDRLGEAFEQRLQELIPPPEPPEPPAPPPAAKPKESTKKDANEQEQSDEPKEKSKAKPLEKPGRFASISRAKGNLFLVDLKSHEVLWSVYEKPKNTSSEQLDRTAIRIVNRLSKRLAKKRSA